MHPEVAEALTSYEFGHREEELSALLETLRTNVLAVGGLDPERYTAVVLTGSGTAANESVLSSVVGDDDTVLVIENGEFGERLAKISRVYGHETITVTHAWGEAVDLDRVARAIETHAPDLVVMVHHETSTGMLNPVEQVGALVRTHGTRLFVDAVSSFSADALDVEAANITFLSTSSGKAIGSYPGLSLVIGTHDAFRALQGKAPRCHYLDLNRYYEFAVHKRQTPNTPAVPLMLALNRALELALEEGIEQRQSRLRALSEHVRGRLREIGLRPLLETEPLSNVLTSVLLPEGVSFEAFREALREHDFVIYGGKGPFEGRMFQVSTIGAVDDELLDRFFVAARRVLTTLRPRQSAVA